MTANRTHLAVTSAVARFRRDRRLGTPAHVTFAAVRSSLAMAARADEANGAGDVAERAAAA